MTVLAALVLAGPASAARGKHRRPRAAATNPAPVGTLYITGGGYGHGIGMSQYGAYGYALQGWSYQQILGHYYTGTQIGTTDPNQTVRVLLSSGPAAFAGATQAANKHLDPSLTYDVVPLADGQLALVNQTTHKRVGKFDAPLTATGPGPLSLAGQGAYRGSLEFRPNGSGGVYTVNALGLDDYVRGVIGAEMPAGWAPQALEAQAVAARTYAITTDVAGGFYNLYPDTRSQMYRGIAAETPSTDAAVAATRGQIVTYNGAPAVTYFFASSGGYTENVEDAWPGATPDPWLRGVPDPYDGAAGDPYDHWTRQLSIAAATARLGRLLNGKLVGIRVTQTGASPRIMSAQVIGTAGTTTVTGQQLQSAFGLLSTWAAFTTMSSSVQAPETGAVHPGSDIEILAQVKRLFGMMAGARPVLTGTIVPARAGATAVIELRAASGWRKLGRVRVGKGGAFAVRTPRAGTYRAVYRGLDGPTVNVG